MWNLIRIININDTCNILLHMHLCKIHTKYTKCVKYVKYMYVQGVKKNVATMLDRVYTLDLMENNISEVSQN